MHLKDRPILPKACQHCGNETGYYVYVQVTGKTSMNYTFNHEIDDNSGLHDPLRYVEQRTMYCQQCHRKIGVLPKDDQS